MKITGRDYTDEDLIAPWDPARRRSIPNRIRDDPARDRNDDDFDDTTDTEPPVGEAKPCQP